MSAFVLRRHGRDGGGFVAKPGHGSSYTSDLRYARKFTTREAAERDRCPENESIIPLEALLDEYRS